MKRFLALTFIFFVTGISNSQLIDSEDFMPDKLISENLNEVISMNSLKRSDLKISYRDVIIHLHHTWTISRESSDFKHDVIVMIEKDGIIGYGEGAPSIRFGETPETVKKGLDAIIKLTGLDPEKFKWTSEYIEKNVDGYYAAKTAFDMAMYDYAGKKYGIPLYKMLGLNPDDTPYTSFSIGIDNIDVIKQKTKEAEPYKILKVKLGTDFDYDIIKTIRSITDKPIRADANEGWTRDEALEKLNWLYTQNVEFVEQPIPAADIEGIRWLRENTEMPIFADEALKTPADMPAIASAYDGVVIKLVKAGGITPALQLIHTAKTLGLKIMIGCMVSTSVAVTAAAHLTPMLEYADLDGNLLVRDDPFDGVKVIDGKLVLPDGPGLGVIPNNLFKK
ncbi:dipeptide epimerase [candidate division KSB1 bacterium]